MNPEQLLLTVIISSTVITTTSTLLLAGYAWSRRPAAGTVPFLLFMSSVAVWSMAQALEVSTTAAEWKRLFLVIQFGGIALGPYFFLLFALSYVGRDPQRVARLRPPMLVPPLFFWLLAATNSRHGLIWRDVALDPLHALLPLETIYGFGFWLFSIASLIYIGAGGFLFVRAFNSQQFYRPQVALLSLTGILVVSGMVLHLFGPPVVARLQPISISFAVASLLGAYTVVRFRTFDIIPVARGRLVDRMIDGVLILDSSDHIIDMNQAAAAILNTPAAAAVGKRIDAALHRHQRLLDVYFSDDKRQLEVAIDQGTEKNSFEINITELASGPVHRSGRLLVLHDISERKKLERIRHDLTYTMVHDLRNPITSNLTMLRMLDSHLDQLPSADRQELISAALESMQRTLKLVDQIMEVNSLESGVVPMEPTTIHLSPLANDLLHSQFSLAAEKNLQLENTVDLDLPPVWADPDLIVRVLQNLVGNAVKFTPEGGGIRIGARVGSGQRIFVYVSDTGPGIAPEVKDQLFEKFAVGPNRGRGSGLGLAFCKMVIEAHNGEIWVESNNETGATFIFTLPQATAQQNGVAVSNLA